MTNDKSRFEMKNISFFLLIFSSIICVLPSVLYAAEIFVAKKICYSDSGKYNKLSIGKNYKVIKLFDQKVSLLINGDAIDFDANCGSLHHFDPFFASGTSSDHLQKQPPTLTDFDKDVLSTCGKWNSKININDFKELMTRNSTIIDNIYNGLGKTLYWNQNQTKEEFLNSFSQIWTESNAFRHIFCGAINNNGKKLLGLHFAPRYQDLFNMGEIGLDLTCSANSVDGDSYTVGVFYFLPDGTLEKKCPSSYVYGMNAYDILFHATLVYKSNLGSSCYYTFEDKNGKKTGLFFVSKNRGIVTLYPKKFTKNMKLCMIES